MTRLPVWLARCIAIGILVLTSLGANAQSPQPLAVPNITVNGPILAMAEQPDGGFVIGGTFTAVNGVRRLRLARLRPDGSVDSDWRADASAWIEAVEIDAAGNIYVGGAFSNIGGVSRAGIAKLSASGIVDPDWSPYASGTVFTLALDGLGHLYVGGGFPDIGGLPRQFLAKLGTEGVGTVDPDWNPSPSDYVLALAFDGKGSVFVGGAFISIGGQTRGRVAKLSTKGTGLADPNWSPSTNDWVDALVLDPAGNVIIGGRFTTISDVPRLGLARLGGSGSGSVDVDWNPSDGNFVTSLAIGTDNATVIVGGSFANMGGLARSNIARLSLLGSGAADPDWNPIVDDAVWQFSAAGNRLLIAGLFSTVGGQTRQLIAALPMAQPPDAIFLDGFDGG